MQQVQDSLPSIKFWSEKDQPREKLINKGRSSLSDAELIAILIGSGSRKESAIQLSQRILSAVGNNLNELAKLDLSELKRFNGIGDAKALSIITALELGRRRQGADIHHRSVIQSSDDVYNYVYPILNDAPEEQFLVLYMNNANKVLSHRLISTGGMTSTLVDVRVLFRYAMEQRATGLILCHNHPSGKLKPSKADINLTKKVKNGGEVLDIQVLDHVIVGEKGYFSFADEGIM